MKTLDNQLILCHGPAEAGAQMTAFGQEGYHLISVTTEGDLWYLTFSNWVSVLCEVNK